MATILPWVKHMQTRRLLFIPLLWSVSHAATAQSTSDEAINLNQSLFLSPQQRVQLAMEAMRGSAEAASKISNFYGFVVLNPIEQHRWAVIAAENGDPAAQFNVYQDFMNNNTDLDRERAMFWLKKSAEGGDKFAQDELKRLQHQGGQLRRASPAKIDDPEKK